MRAMMTDHLRKVMERLSKLPAPIQDVFATEIEGNLDERERHATPLPPTTSADAELLRAGASTLDLAGILNDPAIKPLTAREIDEVLADEALAR